jgi:glycylpeptide N-tetradecanoyltransferase
MRDALVMAKKAGFDCFNCLEIMNNGEFLDELKFGKGTGDLKFYFYNYRCTDIPHDKMGFLML